ncbi:MAG: hypothetical protein Q8Q10_00760 [bacterium]|nr:hypothetical protein [bacterium]
MALEELNEKLHGRDIHLDRTRPHTVFDPGQAAADPNVLEQFHKTEAWQAPAEGRPLSTQGLVFADISSRRRRRWIALALGSIAGLVLLGGLIFKVRSMLFDETRVEISITGPKDVASAEETTFTVAYANKNWAGLANASLILSYPESFHLQAGNSAEIKSSLAEIPIGTIKANTDGKVFIKGKFYGSRGDLTYLKATLRYSPKNVATVFEKTAQFAVNVASSPLSLEITAPLELATGQEVEYVVDYSSKSDVPFSNLRVKMEYPEGFQFVSSEPKPSEGQSVWYIGNLNPRADGKIIIRGVLSGEREERKRVHGMIGFFQGEGKFVAYAENERQTRIISSPLSISQTVNGLTDIAVNPGDVLRYVIRYRNNGDVGVRDAIVTVDINPTALDMGRLALPNGTYDAARKMLIWKASDIPNLGRLEPGMGGEISFSVPATKTLAAVGDKDLSIVSVAKIDSPDLPTPIGSNKIIGSNTLYVKLNALVSVGIKALYDDSVFPNSGPIPPKVGQSTSYTLHVSVANSSNDLKQARVVAILPTGVKYGGKFAPSGETVAFNDRTNELTWDLGTFSATGSAPRELVFQVTTTPNVSQVGKPLVLVAGVIFTAQDTFTHQDIRVEKGQQNNYLSDDKTYSFTPSEVQPAD